MWREELDNHGSKEKTNEKPKETKINRHGKPRWRRGMN
jgi:hypothetical protein